MALTIASYPKTDLKVVVVDGGFGGLGCAVECHLNGHDVVVLEKAPLWGQFGDVISISKSPTRHLRAATDGTPPPLCTDA